MDAAIERHGRVHGVSRERRGHGAFGCSASMTSAIQVIHNSRMRLCTTAARIRCAHAAPPRPSIAPVLRLMALLVLVMGVLVAPVACALGDVHALAHDQAHLCEGVAVLAASAAVRAFGSGWPDLLIAVVLLLLFLRSAWQVARSARAELRRALRKPEAGDRASALLPVSAANRVRAGSVSACGT
ncbi:hypothetical protein QN060_00895 [Xanthomonas oryzae pv. leersiae]|uniref:Uncharacterized protein n=1 Tax=Xanthomonas oryzae pv. leersiae TaxID=3112258 RepID=A0AAJ6GV97_9XANT|nr:hypothetical protein [Xanthomonas oryzae]WIX08738.1 hypothetical protein QN060_00895 [Xanthomonas oryzae pv. oryzae]